MSNQPAPLPPYPLKDPDTYRVSEPERDLTVRITPAVWSDLLQCLAALRDASDPATHPDRRDTLNRQFDEAWQRLEGVGQ